MTAADTEQTKRRDLVTRLAAMPGTLGDAAGRAEHRDPVGDEWPAWKVVLHLLVVEAEVWAHRLHEMSEQENPAWTWTEPDLEGRATGRSLDELVAAFAVERQTTVQILARFDDAGWRRVGTHAVFGRLDVAGLASEVLAHDAEHLADLESRSGRPGAHG